MFMLQSKARKEFRSQSKIFDQYMRTYDTLLQKFSEKNTTSLLYGEKLFEVTDAGIDYLDLTKESALTRREGLALEENLFQLHLCDPNNPQIAFAYASFVDHFCSTNMLKTRAYAMLISQALSSRDYSKKLATALVKHDNLERTF
ncbi:MAG: hypothetical protein NC133_03180 [Prevotella sp.]|nr:hypothetical protein [Prevotella sp.]